MRLKFLTIATILLLAGSSDGRPQKIEVSSDLQPKIEESDTAGWRPMQLGEYVAQDSNPVGKDLPLIVEGNSRYKAEGRRKSYVRNNLFYEDPIAAYGDQKISDMSVEQSDPEAFESEIFNRSNLSRELRHGKLDEFLFSGGSNSAGKISASNSTRMGKIQGIWNEIIDSKNNETSDKSTDDGQASTDPTIDETVYKNKISARYRNREKSRPDLPQNSSHVDSSFYSNPNPLHLKSEIIGNKSRTRTANVVEVRSQITLDSRAVSDSYKPVSVNEEKVRNFVRILPSYDFSRNFTDEVAFLRGNTRNEDLRTGPENLQTVIKRPESKANNTVVAFNRLDNQSNRQQFGGKNSTKELIRIRPQAIQMSPQSITKTKNHEGGEKGHSKNGLKPSVKSKPNSSQIVPDLNLKNWPNDNLQNIEDLFNYEKYTSFHGVNLEAQGVNLNENSSNDHKLTKKPSIFMFQQSLSPGQLAENHEADVTSIHESESQENLEQSAQKVKQWQQIPPFTPENVGPLVAEVNEADSDPFHLIPEGLEFNRPLNPELDQTQSPNYHVYVDESEIVQNNYDVGNDQPIFENPNLEATQTNFDVADVTSPASEANGNDGTYDDYQDGSVYTSDLSNPSYFNPTSVVSQNTVVHILNTGKKRPNVTVTEMKVPSDPGATLNPENSSVDKTNSSGSTPNVHIMFTMQDSDKVEESGQQRIPEITYDDDLNCPTVTINSYTRINNTIQSKEGCTDLNIIINSHVLNTNNILKPATTSTENYESGNKVPSEHYPGSVQSEPSYSTGTGQNAGGLLPSGFQDSPISDGQDSQGIPQSPDTSTFEVFQQTLINIGSQNDVSETFDPDVPNSASSPGDGIPSTPGSGVSALPGTEAVNDPGSLGGPVSGVGNPSIPPIEEIQAPLEDPELDPGPTDALADPGPESVAADTPASQASGGSSGIQIPGISNPLSGITSQLSDAVGNLGSQNGNGEAGDGGIGGPGSVLGDDDDDDDDDLADFMPFSIMESMTSVLPYVTLLNPLNYGVLSVAISPLAVAAAGFLGLAAAFIPWAFPNVLDFGRSANKVTIRLRPNLEEVVQQSIRQYKNWNEWKSRRKKRKR